jgi:hypothetical protein
LSGGSWNYLYRRHDEGSPVSPAEYERMAQRLAALGDESGARRLREVVALLREVLTLLDSMAPQMKAAEWIDSGDWGIDQYPGGLPHLPLCGCGCSMVVHDQGTMECAVCPCLSFVARK